MPYAPPSRAEVDDAVRAGGIEKAGERFGVAALIYTYRCTIACRHCGFGCAAARPDVHMTCEQAVGHLRRLHELGRVIHVAGGEAMLYWDDLARMLEAAAAEGVAPHFVETNASFATDDAVVRARLERLRSAGVAGLFFSADPYHQAHVPPERPIRVRRIAREIFGPENVWGPRRSDEEIREYAAIARDEARLAAYAREHPPQLVATARRELAGFFESHPTDALPSGRGWRFAHTGPDCAIEFDPAKMWELHIDPYDNIQTNCGVILGKATEVSPREVLERGPAEANFATRLLAAGGPTALARWASAHHGFTPPDRAASKCDLCYATRRFLHPLYPGVFGPAEIYAA